jgi:hypothetical protein
VRARYERVRRERAEFGKDPSPAPRSLRDILSPATGERAVGVGRRGVASGRAWGANTGAWARLHDRRRLGLRRVLGPEGEGVKGR